MFPTKSLHFIFSYIKIGWKLLCIVIMVTAALVTIAKIHEQAKCPANIPKAELEGDDDGLWGESCWVKTVKM